MNDDRILTCGQLVETLDDYLDGRVSAMARAAIDAHLAECPGCPALVADVRAIRVSAQGLGPIEPPAHAWQRIQERLHLDAPGPSSLLDRLGLSFAGWRALQPLGAVAGLVLVVSSLAWVGTRLAMSPDASVAGGGGSLVEFQLAEAEYTDAISRLQEAADAAGPRLDALTTATLKSSIDDIDQAIGDAREALVHEPGDTLSQDSLLDALGSKVALLQDTVALAADLEPGAEEQTP